MALRPSLAIVATAALLAAAATALPHAQGTKHGNPEEHLPPYIHQLTAFGERASWSPDGTRIAFMAKSFGDAFVVDVATKMIRLLTPAPSAGFLRVQYLPSGDYFLIGARTFTDIRTTRDRDQEMWLLRASGGPPIALGHKISEGVAISRKTNRIAWSNTHGQYPDQIPEGESVLYMADIVEDGGQPKLANTVELIRAKRPECTLEAQDFRNLYPKFRRKDCEIVGVSRDDVASHDKFRLKNNLPFPLVADTDEAWCKAFDVIHDKVLYGKHYVGVVRSTFLIDADGRLQREWRGVKVPGHAAEVLAALAAEPA